MFMVTGGAGFIGSNLVAALEEKYGPTVFICDRLGDGEKWRNVAKRELLDVIPPDRLPDFLEINKQRLKAVFHMGAVSSTTETDADLIINTNYRMSLALWNWCGQNQVPFIYASSGATYGDGARGFDDDGTTAGLAALRPLNAYGWSKHLFDRRIARAVKDGETTPPQWAGLKFFNAYGPNEFHKGGQMSVISQFFEDARDGKPAKLFKSHNPDFKDGEQKRDFIWVGDCVDVMLWLYENPDVSGLFNCGSGEARTFLDVMKALYGATGQSLEVEFVPTPDHIRAKYQYFTQAEMKRLRDAGYDKPFTSIEDGIKRYVNDYLSQADPYR